MPDCTIEKEGTDMGNSYSAFDYIGLPLGVFLAVIVIVGTLAAIFARIMLKRYQQIWIGLLPAVLLIVVGIGVGNWAVPVLEASGDVVDAEIICTAAGQVKEVRAAQNRAAYFMNGRFCGGAYLSVNNTEYYVIDGNLPETGTWVLITYAPESRAILSWQLITEDAASQLPVETPSEILSEPTVKEPSPQRKRLGQILEYVGYLLLVALGVFQGMFRMKLEMFMLNKDRNYRNEIVPNPTGLIYCLAVLACFAMITTGIHFWYGTVHGFLILILGGAMMLAVQVIPMLTRIRLEGKWLIISRFGEKRFGIEEVASVEWVQKKSISGWAVVIRFRDGREQVLSLDHYWGLTDLYQKLSRKLR